ncbi:unnamed protein product, partial [Cylindrotheca closterium]
EHPTGNCMRYLAFNRLMFQLLLLAILTIGFAVLTDELEIYRYHEEQWADPSSLDIEITRNDWNKTFRTIKASLTNFKGVHGCPLSYTIPATTAIPADPDPSTDYASIEDKIIAHAPIVNTQGDFVATFRTDNTTLWKLLSALFKDTVDWTDIKHCAQTKDGRTAFLDLKSARLGAQYTNNVSAKIERRWLALSYAGPKSNWKFTITPATTSNASSSLPSSMITKNLMSEPEFASSLIRLSLESSTQLLT